MQFRGVDKAGVLYGLGKYDQALECLGEILRRNPTHKGGLLLKARILIDLHQASKALQIVEQVLGSHPRDGEALFTRALVWVDMGQNGQAARVFARLNRRKMPAEDRRYLYAFWVDALIADNRWRAARRVVRESLRRFPYDDILLHFERLLAGRRRAGSG